MYCLWFATLLTCHNSLKRTQTGGPLSTFTTSGAFLFQYACWSVFVIGSLFRAGPVSQRGSVVTVFCLAVTNHTLLINTHRHGQAASWFVWVLSFSIMLGHKRTSHPLVCLIGRTVLLSSPFMLGCYVMIWFVQYVIGSFYYYYSITNHTFVPTPSCWSQLASFLRHVAFFFYLFQSASDQRTVRVCACCACCACCVRSFAP